MTCCIESLHDNHWAISGSHLEFKFHEQKDAEAPRAPFNKKSKWQSPTFPLQCHPLQDSHITAPLYNRFDCCCQAHFQCNSAVIETSHIIKVEGNRLMADELRTLLKEAKPNWSAQDGINAGSWHIRLVFEIHGIRTCRQFSASSPKLVSRVPRTLSGKCLFFISGYFSVSPSRY